MLGRGNEIVITVDPVREEAKQRQEEVRAAAKNDGSGLREWIVEEAAWLVAQFAKARVQMGDFFLCGIVPRPVTWVLVGGRFLARKRPV